MTALLDRVRELAAELGRSPTQLELRRHGIWTCGGGGYHRHRDILVAAGLPPRPKLIVAAMEGKVRAREEVIAQARALAEKLGRSPNAKELKEAGIWRSRYGGLGTLRDVLTAAGLDVTPNPGNGLTAEERERLRCWIIAGTKNLAAALGRSPTHRELREAGLWNPGRGGFDTVGDIIDAAGLPRRAVCVRVGTAQDRTLVERVEQDADAIPAFEPVGSLAERIAASERKTVERLQRFNREHPFPQRIDADLPPLVAAWMA